jgi:glycosyltransferase involved in cell wall biosynthesis
VSDRPPGSPKSDRYQVLMVDPACYSPFYDVPLCRQLRAQGVDVRLLTSRFHYDPTRSDDDVGDACFYPLTTRLSLSGATRRLVAGLEHPLGWLSVLARLRRAGSPAIVHSQWLPLPSVDVAILRAARATGAAWVHTVHDLEPRRESRGSVADFRRAYRSADHLLVHCPDTARGLTARFGVPADRVSRVAVGVSLEASGAHDRRAARRRLDLPREGRLALFFGVVRESKGIEVLIAALSRLADRHRDLRVVIAGRPQGLGRREILECARRSGLDEARVILRLAYVPGSEVPLYFGAADFVVYPYLHADQSAALTLAVANGRAAVVSRVGGLPDLVEDGVSGRIVPPGDVAALAAAMEDLLSDGGRTDAMGEAAVALAARKLSWEEAAAQTAAAYETAIRARRATLPVALKRS